MIRSKLHVRSSHGRAPGAAAAGRAGRVGATIFFLAWLIIPSIILVVIVRDVRRTFQTWRWPAVECTIVRSDVKEVGSDRKYAFDVEYAYAAGAPYEVEPRRHTASVYALRYNGTTNYADAQRLVLRYPPGSKVTCYVNPADPRDAVLKRNSMAYALIVLFPLVFIAIGAGGLYFTWRPTPAGATTSSPVSSGPLSKQAAVTQRGRWVLVLFCAAFAGCGGLVLSFMANSFVTFFSSRSWVPVPATVESSHVRSHRGDDSTTYSVDVLYRYDFNGRTYKSNRYGIMTASSSGYEAKRQIVNRLKPGTRVTAYVNPVDPTAAVLERGFTWEMLLILIPLLFLVGGLIGVFFSARYALRNRSREQFENEIRGVSTPRSASGAGRSMREFAPRKQFGQPSSDATADGPLTLKPRQSPVVKLVGVTILCLFWNGIVSVFLWQVVKGFRTNNVEVCLTIFLIPFVLVGLALVGGVFYSLLALFNPSIVLMLGRGGLRLGESADLRWALAGRQDRVHRLVLRLEGREEATYRRGTDTHTDKNTFFKLDLLDTEDAAQINAGRTSFTVPRETMHSFESPNNKVVWALVVHGHIRGWPDVKDEYPLAVAPLVVQDVTNTSPDGAADGDAREEASWTA